MKSIVGMASWFLTAFASMHIALIEYNPAWNILHMLNLGGMQAPIYYAFGIAGAVSMAMFVQHCTTGEGCSC